VTPLPQRWQPGAVAAGMAGLTVWTALGARAPYRTRYAFEDEYAFARRALEQLPAGCTVFQIAVRADELPHDLDCCLDIPRSPLVLEFPALRFANLPDSGVPPWSGSACTAYYEGAACAITAGAPDRLGHDFAAKAAAYFQERCAAVHRLGRLELVAGGSTSPRTTNDLFPGEGPTVRLYRWTPE